MATLYLTEAQRNDPEIVDLLEQIREQQEILKGLDAEVESAWQTQDQDRRDKASARHWKQRKVIERLVKKITAKQDKEVAQNDPVWVTWKTYGFRHIKAVEVERDYKDYRNQPTISIEGRALCGNTYWIPGVEPDRRDEAIKAISGRDRPLCGLCRKKWKALTGVAMASSYS